MLSRIEKTVLNVITANVTDQSLRIMEFTPGEGHLTKALLDAGYKNIETMDIYPENFKLKEVKCHKGNISEPLPFADALFDLVISVEGIEHLENQYGFAAEINRILKNNGYLIITTPNITNFASRIRFLLTGFYALAARPSSEFEKNWSIEHIYPITFWQLRHILHTNGLFIRQITTDHIRRSALIGAPFYPLTYLFTRKKLREEDEPRQKQTNMEILRQMHAPALYFGRTQIIRAQKHPHSYIKRK